MRDARHADHSRLVRGWRYLALMITIVIAADAIAVAAIRLEAPSQPARTAPAAAAAPTPPASAATPPPPTTTSPPPPPPVVVFGSRDPAGALTTFTVSADGAVSPAPETPQVPLRQVSPALRQIVYAKTIASSSSDYQGCGIAGCTSGIRSVTESGIAIANLDGSGERLLTRGGYDTEPSFSPDGLLIAFLSHVEGDGGGVTDEVVVIDAVGGLVAELAPPASARYANPVWHPEGRSVTVLRTRVNDASAPVVATVPLDQSPPTDIASGHYEDIAWSPDGTRLAVTEMRYDNDPPYPPGHPGEPTGTDLWVLTPGGPPAQNLTNAAPPTFTNVRFCGSSGGAIPRATTPMWSPDGQSIVYLTSYGHIAEYANVDDIDIIRSDGTGHRTLSAARHATCTPGEYAGQSKVTIPDRVTLFGWQ